MVAEKAVHSKPVEEGIEVLMDGERRAGGFEGVAEEEEVALKGLGGAIGARKAASCSFVTGANGIARALEAGLHEAKLEADGLVGLEPSVDLVDLWSASMSVARGLAKSIAHSGEARRER